MTDSIINRDVPPDATIDFVKLELTLKSSLDHSSSIRKRDAQIYSGFFVGILTQPVNAPNCSYFEKYIVLTKDLKSFEVYNNDYFYIMSTLVKTRASRDTTIYKTLPQDQKYAFSFLRSLLDYFEVKNKMGEERELIDLKHYNIDPHDFLFIDEKAILLNLGGAFTPKVSRMYTDPYDITPRDKTGNTLPAVSTSAVTGTSCVHPPSKPINYSIKEPMFFKRTTTKPSKKLIDKLKTATILVSKGLQEEKELDDDDDFVIELNTSLPAKGTPVYNYMHDYIDDDDVAFSGGG